MHVPDGFLGPQTFLPLYAVSAGFWLFGLKQVKHRLREQTIPRLAAITALSLVLMTIALPLPGGTTVHASGVALLGILFDVWIAFIALSTVLFIQALLFGEGGITTLPLNALAMGLLGTGVARIIFLSLRKRYPGTGLFLAGWGATVVSAFLIAVVLGLQPVIAHRPDGTPLFFPFDLGITLPAILIPHVLLGAAEGLLTRLVYPLAMRLPEDTASCGTD